MKNKETVHLSIQQQQQVDDFMRRFDEALKARPTISDEDFLAETEVSDNKGDKDG
jgi:GTPase Era involved in 16S rRNA processing